MSDCRVQTDRTGRWPIRYSAAGYFAALTLGALFVIGGCSCGRNPADPSESEVESGPDATSLQALRSKAFAAQADEDWCKAENAWKEVIELLDNGDDAEQFREEADRNLELVAKLCKPDVPLVEAVELPEPGPEERPEAVEDEAFGRYYPLGQKTQMLALTNVTGQGDNKTWVFQHNAHFVYVYRIVAETEVVKATATSRTFRITFHEVRQTRAAYSETLQLREIESPIIKVVFGAIDGRMRGSPAYEVVRTVRNIINVVDPRAKSTLTWIQNRLRVTGLMPDDEAPIDFAVKIEEVEGAVVDVEYISGVGVSKVEIVEGRPRSDSDLEQLAYTTSLLMDYYIFPKLDAEIGDRWNVRAEDVATMIPFGYGYRVQGQIGVQRSSDSQLGDRSVRILNIDPGSTVQFESRDSRRMQEAATARVISGVVDYCPEGLLVRRARIAWEGTTVAMSKDHLLFGTENIRNMDVQTYYEGSRGEQ